MTNKAVIVRNAICDGPLAESATTATLNAPSTAAGVSWGMPTMPGQLLHNPITKQNTSPPNIIMEAPCAANGNKGQLKTMVARAKL